MSNKKRHICQLIEKVIESNKMFMSLNFGQILREAREFKKLTIDELAEKTGLNRDHIGRLERGEQKNPRIETIAVIAKALDLEKNDVIKAFFTDSLKQSVRKAVPNKNSEIPPGIKVIPHRLVPVLGAVSCGKWKDASNLEYPVGHADEFISLPTKDPNAFVVRAEGDSMIFDKINEGDLLLVEPSSPVKNGHIVLAFDPDNGCTVKKFFKKDDGKIILVPANIKYDIIEVKPNSDFRCYRISMKIEEL